jgi:hypothetical protein
MMIFIGNTNQGFFMKRKQYEKHHNKIKYWINP